MREDRMLEEERKYEVDQDFVLPDLSGVVPPGGQVVQLPPVTLTVRYLDTADLRLARAGVSLRHRRGDALPWTVKLPADSPGVRHEVSRKGRPKSVPAELVALVTVYSRGAELSPAAVVRTVRRAYELRDDAGRVLVEIADDAVSVLAGKRISSAFREIEVERKDGARDLLDRVERALVAAGAVAGDFTPKHVRALGAAAAGRPDLVPAADLPDAPSAGDVVTAAIRRGVERVLTHDPLVRLRAPLGGGDTAVHQMRVGCRRLRSDLRTFAPLVRSDRAGPLREELSWLAGVLGRARDAEVLRDRLHRTAAADPVCPPDAVAPAVGAGAVKLARSLSRVQDLLGEHQDAAVAAQVWLSIAAQDPADHALAVTAGRLAERERASIRAVRAAFPGAWRRATRRRRTAWLP